jgi:subtilisin family serine protease
MTLVLLTPAEGRQISSVGSAPGRVVQITQSAQDNVVKPPSVPMNVAEQTVVYANPQANIREAQQRTGPRRLLVELRARPPLDRVTPGSAAAVATQQTQLARDMAAIDTQLLSRTPAQITRTYQLLFSGAAVTVASRQVEARIRQLAYVKAVYEDVEVHANLNESVPLIGAPAIWTNYGVTGTGVKVAIIDTGIDYTHPDLGGCFGPGCRVVGGYDFVNNDADPRDDYGHGTHVAGIVAANGTLKGVAPGASLLAYKVLNQNGGGFASNIIAGIERAVMDGAKVANLSLGGPGDVNDPMCTAVDNATAAGMLSVISAGNNGPGFLTIGSPGMARTALTVGASSKMDQIANFSSRGYVPDGDHFLMKPEVTAPGVDIRSTVPTTGPISDASGYRLLSGTSMAAPHVAGTAALFLQWNSGLSPADIKSRLAATGVNIGEGFFTQGGGRIALVPAFGLQILPLITNIDFGDIADAAGMITRQQTVTIRNASAGSQTVSLSRGGPALPAGATVQITPSSVTIAAGQSADITVRLQVDAGVTPDAPNEPPSYSMTVVMNAGNQTATIPAYFLRAPLLSLSFDKTVWFVWLYNPALQLRKYISFPGSTVPILTPNGVWDIITGFWFDEAEPDTLRTVVREQQTLNGSTSLSIQSTEATWSLAVNAVDDQQQPLTNARTIIELLLALKKPFTNQVDSASSVFAFAFTRFKVSPLSSRYAFGVVGDHEESTGSRAFAYGLTGTGLTSNVTLPLVGTPVVRFTSDVTDPVSANCVTIIPYVGFALNNGDRSSYGYISCGNMKLTNYFQLNSSGGVPIGFWRVNGMIAFDSSFNVTNSIFSPSFRENSSNLVEIDRSPHFDQFDATRAPDAVLQPGMERWDIDAHPNYLPLRFQNSTSNVQADGRDGQVYPYWVTQTLGELQAISGTSPAFDLYRDGLFLGTFPVWQLYYGIQSSGGAHEVRSTSSYKIGGGSASTRAVIQFDTRKSDPNPPFVSRFRIEQTDKTRTARPSGPATISFEATDDVGLASVSMEWRPAGTSVWSSLALTNTAMTYTATLNPGGPVDLRITATDTSDNTFSEDWASAFSRPFTDEVLIPGSTIIRAAHLTELRTRIDALRVRCGLTAFSWPEPTLIGILVKTVHFSELRGALSEAYTACGRTPTGLFPTDPILGPGTTIKAAHIKELRDAVLAIE